MSMSYGRLLYYNIAYKKMRIVSICTVSLHKYTCVWTAECDSSYDAMLRRKEWNKPALTLKELPSTDECIKDRTCQPVNRS